MNEGRCAVCQRQLQLRWHCTSEDHLDRAVCREAGGDGVWLCSTCEEATHRFMRTAGAGGAAALEALFFRLESLISERRTYRKRGGGR